MEGKKISFGFSKTNKKTEIVFKQPKAAVKPVELIDCLEGKSIKIKDAVVEAKGPLIIPIQDSKESLIERVKRATERRIKAEKEEDNRPDAELSIDELAARQLIRDAKNRNEKTENATKIFTLPLNEDKFVNDGKEESSLDDYDSVPISDYGMAMLRGMGWKEGLTLGKNPSKEVKNSLPDLRPKGLGLGANKMVKDNKPKPAVDKSGKELTLIKNAYAKIIAGTHRGRYCQIQGLDDENCRVIARTSVGNEILTLNEFLVVPITKEEHDLACCGKDNKNYNIKKENQQSSSSNRVDESDVRSRSHRRRSSSREKSEGSGDDRRRSKHKSHKSHKSKRDRSSERHRSDKNHSSSSRHDHEKEKKHKKKSKSKHKHRRSSDSD